ncbi:MAG: glycosyltransferase family 9 protein [Bacteroidetes bacterium]|nr:glycosyltransferase family 9 protein [Bacteroidota bacterium]
MEFDLKKILVVQTAFIGDVVLATAVLEKLRLHFPAAKVDFLLRKGNESLLDNHPYLNGVLVWDKKHRKYGNLFRLIFKVRRNRYDLVVNLQRFFSTGFLTAFSGAKTTVGFDKNLLSFLFKHRVPHGISNGEKPIHEVERNLSLIVQWTDNQFVKPKIYPSKVDFEKVHFPEKHITISPASVWFTKQFPAEKWLVLMNGVGEGTTIFLLGGKGDVGLCGWLKNQSSHKKIEVKAGKLSFLESAALMQRAAMNFVNDSAPLHLASAVNAHVTAVFCSTVPRFGFGPLSDDATVLETEENLRCRPCGLHGKKACPEGHFRCAEIDVQRLLAKLG